MSTARRKILVETAQKHGVPIVEDDPYGELRFEGEHHEPALDVAGGRGLPRDVLQDPGAWFPPGLARRAAELYDEIVFGKQPVDLHTSTAPRWRPTRSAAATTASSWSSTSRRSGTSIASAAT